MKRLVCLLSVFALLAAVAPAATKGAEPARISQGETVVLADHLVPGKTVIFDFTSAYCPPCRAYDEPLHELHAKRADLVVVKVDINRPGIQRIDWKSPVAAQFALRSIPHFKVYGPDGQLIAEDRFTLGPDGQPTARDPAGRKLVDGWIKQLAP